MNVYIKQELCCVTVVPTLSIVIVVMLLLLVFLATASASFPVLRPPWCPIPKAPLIPPDCGLNAKYHICPRSCPPLFCSSLWSRHYCPPYECCEPSCICNNGFLRSDLTGHCIPIPECFKMCDNYEHYEVNSPNCRRTCANRFVTGPHSQCKPFSGCVCNGDLVKLYDDGTGPCIPEDLCPRCGPNEVVTDCKVSCPPETCDSIFTSYNCKQQECKVGCKCKDNYLKNELGICIPSENCSILTYDYKCTPTCAIPNPQECATINEDCAVGYVLSEYVGRCIPIGDCQSTLGCNGDPNAVIKQYPLPCPSTCNAPNAKPCHKAIDPVGCECLPGYIINDEDGKCIKPEECPGGYPCRQNETFIPCKASCPSHYCPWKDFLTPPECQETIPCYSGCACDYGFKHKSRDDDQCILGEECQEIECTRPNEVWNPCPSTYLREYCGDPGDLTDIFTQKCDSRCVCQDNYLRNASDICIPADKCPCDEVRNQKNGYFY